VKRSACILVVVLVLSLFLKDDAIAQCAMCKAVAGSNLESDANDVGRGLNTGILYLMAIPYIMLMGLFFLFFKDKIMTKLRSLRN
jgi:hypothetical protein